MTPLPSLLPSQLPPRFRPGSAGPCGWPERRWVTTADAVRCGQQKADRNGGSGRLLTSGALVLIGVDQAIRFTAALRRLILRDAVFLCIVPLVTPRMISG